MSTDWKKDLFRYKSLFSVVKNSSSVSRSFNFTVILGTLIVSSVLGFLSFEHRLRGDISAQSESLARWGDFGAMIVSQLLGFLIAAFTIFATVTRPKLFVLLAKIPHSANDDISEFHYIFSSFIHTFLVYACFIAFCLVVKFLFQEDSLVRAPVIQLGRQYEAAGVVIIIIVFVGYLTFFATVLIELKSLIWNIYQTILITIATHEESNREGDGSST